MTSLCKAFESFESVVLKYPITLSLFTLFIECCERGREGGREGMRREEGREGGNEVLCRSVPLYFSSGGRPH